MMQDTNLGDKSIDDLVAMIDKLKKEIERRMSSRIDINFQLRREKNIFCEDRTNLKFTYDVLKKFGPQNTRGLMEIMHREYGIVTSYQQISCLLTQLRYRKMAHCPDRRGLYEVVRDEK